MAITLEVAQYFAVLIEMFVYGIYTALFASALSTMLKKGHPNSGAQIYLIATLLMFALATLHISLAFFRFIRAYVFFKDPLGPIAYLYDFTRWDTILDSTVYCVVAWVGDFLVIYRCYYVWNRNIWIVILPILLVSTSIAVNIYVLWWFTHPNAAISLSASTALVGCIYPLALSQNFITTCLIALKIYKQHQVSTCHGIVDRSSKLSLLRILRIIIESAMLYTAQIAILIILYYTNNNAEVILRFAIVPSVGIVFLLISLRVNMAKSSNTIYASGLGTIPEWLAYEDEGTQYNNASLTPDVVNFRVSQTGHLDDAYSGPFSSSTYPHKNRRSVKSLSRDSNTL